MKINIIMGLAHHVKVCSSMDGRGVWERMDT